MKNIILLSLLVLLVSISVFMSCDDRLSDDELIKEATEECMTCHSGDTEIGNQILGAKAGYDNSGHLNGPRTYTPTGSDHMFVFHGSNAVYANGSCEACHNHQGFIGDDSGSYPSPIGCFTCHNPHEDGDFSVRKSSAVTLVDGSSFDSGTGNLCANCHLARTDVDDFMTDFWDTAEYDGVITSRVGPHHGPHADYLVGVNYADSGANTFTTTNNHGGAPDGCVTCHHIVPTERARVNLQFGGHGFYLKGAVHEELANMTSSCTQCHDDPADGVDWPDAGDAAGNSALFTDIIRLAPADWDGDGSTENVLDEINGLRNTLIAYFGDGTTYFAGAGTGAIVSLAGGDVTSGEWYADWEFQNLDLKTMGFTQAEAEAIAEAFWNFKYFIEDKSDGIHNPVFAAQMLYDGIDNINTNVAGVTLQLGATWPQ